MKSWKECDDALKEAEKEVARLKTCKEWYCLGIDDLKEYLPLKCNCETKNSNWTTESCGDIVLFFDADLHQGWNDISDMLSYTDVSEIYCVNCQSKPQPTETFLEEYDSFYRSYLTSIKAVKV